MAYVVRITSVERNYNNTGSEEKFVRYFCHHSSWVFLNQCVWDRIGRASFRADLHDKIIPENTFKSKFHAEFCKKNLEKYRGQRVLSTETYEVIKIE